MKCKRAYLESLKRGTLPHDGGQIVARSYAADEDGLFRFTLDQSDQSLMVEFAEYDDDADEYDLRFEPWNGALPAHGDWQEVEIVG